MRILVSTSLPSSSYPGYLVSSNLRTALDNSKVVDCVVIHSFSEPATELIRNLTNQYSKSPFQLLYIASPESFDSSVQVIVEGLGGQYYDDEFYLESQGTLDQLRNSHTSIATLNVDADRGLLRGFVKSLSEGADLTPARVNLVNNAIDNLFEVVNTYQTRLKDQAETAVGIFRDSDNTLASMQKVLVDLSANLEKSKTQIETSPQSSVNNVWFFSRISVSTSKKIVRIKSVTGMLYLTSFMMGLQNHYQFVEHKRPRLIFIENPGDIIKQRYKNFTWLDPRTPSSSEDFHDSIVFTNYPSSSLMNSLIEDKDYDVVIIVDRLSSSSQHIIRTPIDNVIYAVNSASAQSNLRLPPARCITSVVVKDSFMLSIPSFSQYPTRPEHRVNTYSKTLSDSFKRIVRSS